MFLADTDEGRVRVIALGRDEADAQFLARAWRFVAYRDAAPVLFPTRRRQVDVRGRGDACRRRGRRARAPR